MRKALTSLWAVVVVASVAAPPASAHGALSETYTVSANTPLPLQNPKGRCSAGVEDVHKDSHSFQLPRAGTLTVRLDEYVGDWDVEIVDKKTGSVFAYADGVADAVQTVGATLSADQEVDIVACNFVGGPTARVSFTFSPSTTRLVSVGDASVAEGDAGGRKAAFTVSLSKPAPTLVTVAYATANASASSAQDYTAASGTLEFPPGTVSTTVKVRVGGDITDEGDERFTLALSSPAGPVAIGRAEGVGTIMDDDPGTGVRLAVGDVAVVEGNLGTRMATFTVGLSEPSPSAVMVSYATANGSAVKSSDYRRAVGTLKFPPGTTSATVGVPVTADRIVEGNETFTLKLSGATGATISDATGNGLIIDDI